MPKTRVLSLRDRAAVAAAKADGTFVRIDRMTRWGNPFRMTADTPAKRARVLVVATREAAVEAYRAWLLGQPALLARVPGLRGKVLGCWCQPAAGIMFKPGREPGTAATRPTTIGARPL